MLSVIFRLEMSCYNVYYLGVLWFFCVAATERQRRHDRAREETWRATQNGGATRARRADGEMKPEPTMAGESENVGTGLGLDRGFHRQSLDAVDCDKSLIQGQNSVHVYRGFSYTPATQHQVPGQVHELEQCTSIYSAFHTSCKTI